MDYTGDDGEMIIRNEFDFLQDLYGFQKVEQRIHTSYVTIIYRSSLRKVIIMLDFMDEGVFVMLAKGPDTPYPSDTQVGKKLKPLSDLVKKYEPDYDPVLLEHVEKPSDYLDLSESARMEVYQKALRKNAAMLKLYGDKYLRGMEWP